MRSHRPILFFALLVSAAALLLTGCPTPMDGTLGAPNAGDTGAGLIATTLTVDPSRGVAVFVDSDGTQTVVESEEGGELIGCVEIIDYDVIEDDADADTARYGWSRPGASVRVIVLGVRSDGKPGLWIIYRGGGAAFVEGDAEENQQELFESFSEYYEGHESRWGWDFDVQKMSEESGGVWIIVGTARNPKVQKFFGYVPQVVVYWSLIQKKPGRLILTKARPVAVDELSSKRHWLFYYFRMWSFLWAENYLKELDLDKDIEVDDNDEGIFGIIGTDKNDVKSIGTVTARKVLDIVEYEVQENRPPFPPILPPYPVDSPLGVIFPVFGNTLFETVISLEDPPDPDAGDTVEFVLGNFYGLVYDSATTEWNYDISQPLSDFERATIIKQTNVKIDPVTGVFSLDTNSLPVSKPLGFEIKTFDGELYNDPGDPRILKAYLFGGS